MLADDVGVPVRGVTVDKTSKFKVLPNFTSRHSGRLDRYVYLRLLYYKKPQ